MAKSTRVLEVSLVAGGVSDRERAELLVDRLAALRRVGGEGPRWAVVYPAADVTEAMALCETDLTQLDPTWFQILEIRALPSLPLRDAEFG